MPLTRILNPYPEGLGWKWNRSHRNIGYIYQSPYPETSEFQNIKVTAGACRVVKDAKVIRWFKVMGGQVKSLQYSSPLNCSHQNMFLGSVLNFWCPNLETLHLTGIQCFSSLLYICEGSSERYREFNGQFNCASLKNLIISVDGEDLHGEFLECHHKTDYCLLQGRRAEFGVVKRCHEYFSSLIDMLPDKHIEKERDALFYQLIENGQIENLPENFVKDKLNPMFDSSHYFPYGMLDWGILGLLLRVAPIEKIVVEKLVTWQQCREFILFLLYQPSKLRSTLKHLEFRDNVFVGRDSFSLKTLSMFKCSLRILRLDNFIPFGDSLEYFYNLLKGCGDTLNVLEIGTAEYVVGRRRAPSVFKVPPMPNLVKIVHRNISMLALEGDWILMNCPKLKICEFIGEGYQEQSNFMIRALNKFCENLEQCAELGNPLRELRINKSLGRSNIEQLGKGLGNLVKVDLEVDGADELECLLEWMGKRWKKVENVRIRMGKENRENGEVNRWNEVISEKINKMEGLKFLDLVFQTNGVTLSVELFRDGFGEMEKLTSLKITNFQVLLDDKEEIEKVIAHIPFVLFSEMRFSSVTRSWFPGSRCSIC